MPKGKPNPQTVASEKYQKRAGYVAKTFKLKQSVVDEFAEACEKTGVSMAGQLTKMMQAFVEEANQEHSE